MMYLVNYSGYDYIVIDHYIILADGIARHVHSFQMVRFKQLL